MSDVVIRVTRRVLLPLALLFALMVGLGLLVTRVLAHTWPFTVEDTVNRELAGDRTPGWNDVSLVFSTLASTQMIVVVTVLAALVLRLVLHRWREPLFLCAAVTAQALIFLFTTMVIDRNRPAVAHMDASPPTSSFPSGHTSAATALYVGLAVLLALRARSTPAKIGWWTLLVLVPIGVALTRMYRGMHHPSDVVASFLNGGVCVAIMARAVLDRTLTWGRAHLPLSRSGDEATPAGASAGG
ncbi:MULTISPECIES: phosphatase PAP2 family protein [unclassified Micromonospora]|uniref:phosphatase PAP2 family protein n=1 Tax=unclassified Micromonospora TaxID=2617518 RepID=UPI0018905F1E|nr:MULTISPECIES: phosphatase PAP2 family protein [unclassified Micromonospora]MBF5032238.1 phosphatase PAP2 family protein [Micromonospora sp. ANENR4]MCZ7478048.1 phosphatase PAP2 family protein [Micromonospora sp. WMMC273]MDW3850686.1 phosphatase PAP2 family protein [Micromonospora sp. BRA006-A]MEE3918829.1 phosphatase PAP2 family protein [Micromonospora sp. BRA006-A]WBC02775.1 phosphatase PAP2 family protein [Micromonospora sp. WMMA1976]